ncbi:MAG TPA: ribokinase, partial [Fimbriimonas sp.]|nr:ribokinase [Fimbriimonas sp.]
EPGNSVRAQSFASFPGGKGANQAVAAARLGAEVRFCGCVGNDLNGHGLIQEIKAENINCDDVIFLQNAPTALASITVDATGENSIVVNLGANMHFDAEEAVKVVHQRMHHVVVLQGEIPLEVNRAVAEVSQGIVILNPAPPMSLPIAMYPNIDYLTPNAAEASAMTGLQVYDRKSAMEAANVLVERGCHNVIVTIGKQGAVYSNATEQGYVAAPKVSAVDTVGAGDCFNGSLAFAVAHNASLENATKFAVECASISVRQHGAQGGMPYWYELDDKIKGYLVSQ